MTIDGSQRRQRLRSATQPAHARLDALIDGSGFLEDRVRYARYLHATWAARRPAELALEASRAATVYAAWPQRRVCDALSQDIADIDETPPRADPIAAQASAPLSPGQALGVLYVLEGSALGARLLERRAAAIGMTPAFGARHLARQTSQPKAWTGFVALLDQAPLDTLDDARCVAAAVETFGAFERAFRAAAR